MTTDKKVKPGKKPTRQVVAAEWEGSRREPTSQERAAMDAATIAQARRPARVAVDVEPREGGGVSVGPQHSDASGFGDLLRETFGTRTNDFVEIVLTQLDYATRARGSSNGTQSVDNYALAALGAIGPRDEWEAMIASHIIGAHTLGMEMLGKARHADTRDALGFYVEQHRKLTTTLRTLTETIDKHRSGGKQQVIVRHVYINGNAVVGDGAQAVFGQLNGGGPAAQLAAQSHATAVAGVFGPALWGEDQALDALPVASSPREASLSDARGHEPGRAEGNS